MRAHPLSPRIAMAAWFVAGAVYCALWFWCGLVGPPRFARTGGAWILLMVTLSAVPLLALNRSDREWSVGFLAGLCSPPALFGVALAASAIAKGNRDLARWGLAVFAVAALGAVGVLRGIGVLERLVRFVVALPVAVSLLAGLLVVMKAVRDLF